MHLSIRCLRLVLLAAVALPSFVGHGAHAASGQHLLADDAKAREACPDYTAYARHRQYVALIP